MLTTLPDALATALIPQHPSFLQGVEFLAGGQIVVLLVLTVLTVFMYFLGATLGKKAKDAANAVPVAARAAAPAAAVAVAPVTDSRLIAIIAAAAHTVLGANVRIVSVQPASTEWSAQGRRDIFSSHKLR